MNPTQLPNSWSISLKQSCYMCISEGFWPVEFALDMPLLGPHPFPHLQLYRTKAVYRVSVTYDEGFLLSRFADACTMTRVSPSHMEKLMASLGAWKWFEHGTRINKILRAPCFEASNLTSVLAPWLSPREQCYQLRFSYFPFSFNMFMDSIPVSPR